MTCPVNSLLKVTAMDKNEKQKRDKLCIDFMKMMQKT